MRRLIPALAVLAALALPASSSASWPTWGNLEHPDCSFAAAANWELLHGGTTATEESILTEFAAAPGTAGGEEGMDGDTFEAYWHTHGIGGRRATVRDYPSGRLLPLMRAHGPIIAELAATPGERWGNVVDDPGGIHFAVVRYVNRRGPVLLTWGQFAQMTWSQWNEDAFLLYVPRPV